jgi:hypothetical protein
MLEFAKPLRASVEEEFTPLGLRPSATRDPNRHSQCSRQDLAKVQHRTGMRLGDMGFCCVRVADS